MPNSYSDLPSTIHISYLNLSYFQTYLTFYLLSKLAYIPTSLTFKPTYRPTSVTFKPTYIPTFVTFKPTYILTYFIFKPIFILIFYPNHFTYRPSCLFKFLPYLSTQNILLDVAMYYQYYIR